jgi:hypothetical protein
MREVTPNLLEWRQLYNAVIEFKNAKPWEWMHDDDIFGIKDLETGEIGYCCIMGNLGEHFGIACYLGSEGLDGILSLLSGELDPEDPDSMHIQKCLVVSFEDREILSEEDRKVIKELGLKFRGRNQWPLIRNHSPGLLPWFITSNESRFLTNVLIQAIHVSLMCKNEGKEILYSDEPLTFLTRVPQERNGILEWQDEYIAATPYTPQYVSYHLEDEIKLKRLQLLGRRKGAAWEIDTFFSPGPIQDNNRPYFPKICLIIEQTRGLILSFDMVKDIVSDGHKFIDMVINLIERSGHFPSRIFVQREETYYLLMDICDQLGINIEMVDRLHILQDARYEMYDFFNGFY